MDRTEAEVIVTGAGPTGLMMAGELRLHGISVIVLEKLAEPVEQSRALGFSARAIEEFSQRGLLPRFGDVQTIPVGHFGGLPLDFREVAGGSYGARGIPQARTEAILADWATGLGAEVRRRHEVTGLTQHDDRVELTVETQDGPQTLFASYVVGCDGGRSTVRKLSGIEFPGTDPQIEMWMADLTGPQLQLRFSGERVPGGMIMVLPAGPNVFRIGIYDRASTPGHPDHLPTFPELADVWQRLTGEDIHDATPLWVSKFTDASRQAAEYRKGRVFVAGDAAHIHLPQGAQGMSAGIGDAMNLGWKLAAQLRGYAPAGLLDTYHTERYGVAERIIANTLAQRILYLSGDELSPLREVFQELLAYQSVRRHLAGMVSGLDIRYDLGDAEGDNAHPLCGARLPDHELVGESSGGGTAYEHLHLGRAVVFDFAADPRIRTAAQPWHDRVDVVTAKANAPEWPQLADIDALLVRPDGYIAWVATGGTGPDGLQDALARWFVAAG